MIYYPIIKDYSSYGTLLQIYGRRFDDFKVGDFIVCTDELIFFRKVETEEYWHEYRGVKNNKLNRKLYNFNTIFSDNKYLIISNNP